MKLGLSDGKRRKRSVRKWQACHLCSLNKEYLSCSSLLRRAVATSLELEFKPQRSGATRYFKLLLRPKAIPLKFSLKVISSFSNHHKNRQLALISSINSLKILEALTNKILEVPKTLRNRHKVLPSRQILFSPLLSKYKFLNKSKALLGKHKK